MGACNETIKKRNPSEIETSLNKSNNQQKNSSFEKPKFDRSVKRRQTISK